MCSLFRWFRRFKKREEPEKPFFLNAYYARVYRPGRPFRRDDLKFETFAPDGDGCGCGCGCFGLMSVVFLVIAIGVVSFLVANVQQITRVDRDGIASTFTVTACEMVGKGDSRDPQVSFSYEESGVQYNHTVTLNTLAECTDFYPGKVLTGKYLHTENDSIRVRFDDVEIEQIHWVIYVVVALVVVFVTAMVATSIAGIIAHWRALRLYRKLVSKGRLLDGMLLEAKGVRDGDKFYVVVTYTFTTPQGRNPICEQRCERNYLANELLPRKGKSVKVLYADDKNFFML